MEIRRQHFLVYRILCFLMALHVLNISIDIPDRATLSGRATTYHEDLSSNEIESISEFILETCLGIIDAVPEHDDPDDESEPTGQVQDYAFTQLFKFIPMLPSIHYLTTVTLPFRTAHVPAAVSEIFAPPPQR